MIFHQITCAPNLFHFNFLPVSNIDCFPQMSKGAGYAAPTGKVKARYSVLHNIRNCCLPQARAAVVDAFLMV